jgi:drug/metabolite transporter (DMT)-like permease
MVKNLFQKKYLPHVPKDHSKAIVGVILTLLGWFLSAGQTAIIKIVSHTIPAPVIFFFLFLCILLYLTIFLIIKKEFSHFVPVRCGILILRCTVSVASYFTYILSGLWNSLADNSLLLNTEAIFVPFVLRFFRKQGIKITAWSGIIIGFIGVGLICSPDKVIINPGALIGLLSGLGIAIGIYLTSVAIKTETPLRIGFYHSLIALVLTTPSAIYFWETPSPVHLLYIASAAFLLCIALYVFFKAFHYTESHVIGMLSYSLVIFSGLLDWLVWGIIPTYQSLVGFILILTGGVLVINHYRNLDKKKKSFFL